jgi:GTP-binding protein
VVGIDETEFVVADIPGLIAGAHEGTGLGDRFLGHVERCAVLLHLVDATSEDPVNDYKIIINELEMYGGDLAGKQRVTALNKVDALTNDEREDVAKALEDATGSPVMRQSGVSREGLQDTLRVLRKIIDTNAAADIDADKEPEAWRP